MRDPRAVEQRPVAGRDGPLVADDQRQDDAAVAAPFEQRCDAIAQRGTGAFDQGAGRDCPGIDQAGQRAHARGANRPGRPQVALEQPRLEVESARVLHAMRPLQSHGELPALRWLQRGCVVVPTKQKPARHGDLWREHPLHVELETHAPLEPRRQRRDHAFDDDVLALVGKGKCIGKAQRGVDTGVQESGGQRHAHADGHSQAGSVQAGRARPCSGGRDQRGGRKEREHRRRRQLGLQLQKTDATDERRKLQHAH